MCGYFCIEFINYMLKGKTLLDYTYLFSSNDFKKNDRVIKRLSKNEYYELSDTAKLSSSERVNNYRLNQIDKIKDYFNNEINERKDIIKKLNKYIVSFDYLDKIFMTLSALFGTLSKDELPHELLFTTRQYTKLRNDINNNLATDIKLSKYQIKKLIQSGGFLGKLLSKLAGPLMKVAMPLAKNVLAPLGLTAAMSAIDQVFKRKFMVQELN